VILAGGFLQFANDLVRLPDSARRRRGYVILSERARGDGGALLDDGRVVSGNHRYRRAGDAISEFPAGKLTRVKAVAGHRYAPKA
jgi:hypothetical protein